MNDLAVKGFRMLDIKPNHIILRRRLDGSLLARHGRLSYALVDFELLQRTEEYRKWHENEPVKLSTFTRLICSVISDLIPEKFS
jgi:hypothetical protein